MFFGNVFASMPTATSNSTSIDEKINKEDRDSYPILVDSNDTILWIPGIKKSKYDRLKIGKYDIIVWCTKEENNE